MKRKGFTIAEILIIMGILGVVAALTIPTFTASYKRQTYASTLSTAIANFESALTSAIVRDGVTNLYETELWAASQEDLPPLLRMTYSNADFTEINQQHIITTKGGTTYRFDVLQNDPNARQETEVLSQGGNLTASAGNLIIDVNGDSRPNQTGRDQFRFIIGNDGHLYPIGGRDWAAYSNVEYTPPRTACVENRNMNSCGAYLMENGFKMDY